MKTKYVILFLLIGILVIIYGNVSQIFALSLIAICLKRGAGCQYFYNPYWILIITLVSYLCYSSVIGGYFLDDLEIKTQILIVSSLAMIILGFISAERKKIKPISVGKYSENFWIIFLLGFIPTIITYALFGNVLELTGDSLIEAKGNQGVPIIGQMAYFLPASILIACKKDSKVLIVISIIFSIIAALFTVTKTAVLVAALFLVFGIVRYRPSLMQSKVAKLTKKTLPVWLPIGLIFFFVFNNAIRHDATSNRDMDYMEQGGVDRVYKSTNLSEGLYLNYLYFTSPWSNLNYNVKNNQERGYGRNIFAQFSKKIGIDIKTVNKNHPTFLNTFSYLTDIFLDFGFIGSIIFSFFFGFLIFLIYKKFGYSDDPLLLAFYVLVAYATFMLFFNNHFNNGYLLNYFITFVGYSYIARKLAKK